MSNTQDKKQQELRLISKPISVATDGNSLTLNTNNVGDLTFFQIKSKTGNIVEAVGVASIRVTFNDVKKLRDLLTRAIADHEKKMEAKGQKA